ncbi:wall-associated receptor kinase-like 14 [Euphorbia lathyris]|uniref:wall-associated receptor kinase-like 14 n=1 Tax=Euphorbia lathyris TaxID=212925 RepID=UPI0033133130
MTLVKKSPNLLLLLSISIFLLPLIAADANCNHTCGKQHLSYPFGFSSGCPIQLNCSSSGDIFLDEHYPVLYVNDDTIRISLQPQCNRSIETFPKLFTKHFAPSSTNAILLYNCSSAVSPCSIPAINVHLESLDCANNTSISCIYDPTVDGFFHRNQSQLLQCEYLLSSISVKSLNDSGVSLDISVMDLVWWIPGNCSCSEHADCREVLTPDGPGHRCLCKDGFVGDGFSGGTRCERASCNVAKFWSGDCGGSTRIIVLIGASITGVSLPIAVAILCCYIHRRKHHPKSKGFRKIRLSEVTGFNIPIYPYREIEKATNNFSEKQRLGTGAFGTVYAGKLNNDLWVAIKRIKQNDNTEQVMNEIKLISSVNHPNLVRLLGCSLEYGEQILVYEFMPNGTLCQHLQGEKGDAHGLTWPVRLTIACETAQAVAHLHSAINPPIYHRDIKSSNILLDYNFTSKVADFGLSRLGMTEISHISTAPQGTPGYLDPQYHQNFHLSDKSDVYSFGVVLVEIITSLKVVDFCRPANEVNLAALAVDKIGKGRLSEIIDPYLDIKSDDWGFSSLHKVAELAFRCLAFDRDMRPSMMEVAAELEQIRLSRWPPPHVEEMTASSRTGPSSSSSSSSSSCSSSCKVSENPLSFNGKKYELGNRGLFTVKSMDVGKDSSPVCVQDPWLSEQSSPSSSSLLSTVTQ